MPDPDTRGQVLFWPGVLAVMGIAATLAICGALLLRNVRQPTH